MCVFRNHEDYFFDCETQLEDVYDKDPRVLDNDEEGLEENLSDDEYVDCLECFDVELEPTFKMPYKVAPDTDPLCLLLDKLIRDGKLSRNSFFYKNISEVAKHLEDPSSKWDPEVCEALMSIRHLGGKATMNHVIGPLSRGQGRPGRKTSSTSTSEIENSYSPVLNYGGPSSGTLQKFVPGTMPISGISKILQLSSLRLLDLSEVKTVLPKVELFSVALQMDGTMLRAGLSWDPKLGFILGCQDPLTFQDLKEKKFHLSGDYLKTNLVTEVDVTMLVSLCSSVSLSLGYQLQPSGGKKGYQIVEKYTEIIKTVSKCEACVRAKAPYFNTIRPDTPCDSLCDVCWQSGVLCGDCKEKGRLTIYPQIEPCFQCLEKGILCKKAVVLVLALDCFTGNRYLIEKYQKDLVTGSKDPEIYLTEAVGEIIHVLKTIKSSFSNWYLLGISGHIFNLSMLRTLRDDNLNKEVSCALRKVLQKGSVVNRDRQDTDCLVEFKDSVEVLREVTEIDPVVVHRVCPEKYKLEPTNSEGSIGPVRHMGAVNIGHFAVLAKDGKDENKSTLSILEFHSPVKIKEKLEMPQFTGMATSEAVIFISCESSLHFVELVKGSVIPKIPSRKADLVSLCRELSLPTGGTVKELKGRLAGKLRPSSKLQSRFVKLDPELSKHLNKKSILSKSSQQSGRMEHLQIVDNLAEKIVMVDLVYEGGEVNGKMKETGNFPVGVKDIKVSVHTTNEILLASDDQLTVLNSSFELVSQMKIHSPIADVCIDEKSYFLFKVTRFGLNPWKT